DETIDSSIKSNSMPLLHQFRKTCLVSEVGQLVILSERQSSFLSKRPEHALHCQAGEINGQGVVTAVKNGSECVCMIACCCQLLLRLQHLTDIGHCSCPRRLPLRETPRLFFDFRLFFQLAALVVAYYLHESLQRLAR